ncbi:MULTISPECIES: SPOR domain-containing protein [unclassified Lentimicrobium]|uniref:SPOR domain-containing protein n=1 Tax=unclassified Lentimicrobium TaxID=2677434 RepID=UPI001551E576|nr:MULTISPECIES: SPOR domain-containing protein [unclassified Lentimicrobium]NPD45973.1 SPOR domain-containing protein [Lentimicrobium sp. S6]NPD84260.1 SPOR domain-containing protein [Lentimicrobium sp. L6]
MIKFKLLVSILFFCPLYLLAQTQFIQQDSKLDSLIILHKRINSLDSLVPGYRVQIFFESGNYSKDLAMATAEKFQENYPEIRYYLSFSEPYYRIRVGDFRTIIEAKGFLKDIIDDYPAAFEVKDKIYNPPLFE